MKYMFASDIHGSAYYCRKMLDAYRKEQADRLVLLGDLLYHGPRNDLPRDYAPKEVISMLNGIKEQIYAVRGNCEAEVDQMVLDFPVGFLLERSTTFPTTCSTHSVTTWFNISLLIAWLSAEITICVIPNWSRKSINTIAPKFLIFCTQPASVTCSPMFLLVNSPQL